MASKKITVDGEELILASQEEYKDYLKDEKVKFLKDSNGIRIGGFASLENNGTYTSCPPRIRPPQQQQVSYVCV